MIKWTSNKKELKPFFNVFQISEGDMKVYLIIYIIIYIYLIIFLRQVQAQSRNTVNQDESWFCMEFERNRENKKKIQSEDKITRGIKNRLVTGLIPLIFEQLKDCLNQ